MGSTVRFAQVKRRVVAFLLSGDFSHEGRADIEDKNLLQVGKVSAAEVAEVLRKSGGANHHSSPHHQAPSILVHVIFCRSWYVKFYFDPDTTFISVHQ